MAKLSWLILALLAVTWLAARTLSCWPLVFPQPGQVRLLEMDSYFHVRHARSLVKNFPRVQRWDPSTHYPHGQRGENQGGYDLLLASLALAAGLGHPDQPTLLATAAWVPVVLGTLAFLMLGLLGRKLAGPRVGLLAPWLLLLYPAPLATYAVLGFADHHAFEVCLALATCLAMVWALQTRRSLWLALPVIILLYSWAGSALYLLVLALCLSAAALAGAREVDRLALATAAWIATLWLLPTLLWPDLSLGERYHRAALLALVGFGLGVPALARGLAWRRRPAGRLLLASLVAVCLGLLALEPVRGMLAALLEPRPTTILEHRQVTLMLYWGYFALAGLLAPLGLLAAWRSRQPGQVAAALFAALLVGLWVRTRDFSYFPPPFIALLATLALAPLLQRRWALPAATALLSLPALLGWTTPAWPQTALLRHALMVTPGWIQAAEWIESNTPEPTLDLDSPLRPWQGDLHYPAGTYGVYTPWDRGHLVAFLARRPVVLSATESRQGAAWLATDQEEQALEALEAGCQPGERVEYVVLGCEVIADSFLTHMQVAGIGPERILEPAEELTLGNQHFDLPVYGELYRRSIAARLFEDAGLKHFRLVYETPALSFVTYLARYNEQLDKMDVLRRGLPLEGGRAERLAQLSGAPGVFPMGEGYLYRGQLLSEVKVFQVVAGARVHGREASLVLHCQSSGRTFTYRQQGPELILPYPTTSAVGEVRAQGPYLIDGRPLHVTEDQVQRGLELQPP